MYADVIVDMAAGQLDKVFQYDVPETMAQSVSIGSQVIVPFGAGNRKVRGFVIGFSEKTDYDPMKIKPLESVVDGELTAENQMIRIAYKMKQVYGSTMIQALKTVIPVRRQVQAVIRRYYRPKASKAQAPAVLASVLEDRRSRAKSRLMTWFLEDEGTPDGEFHWFSKETVLAASGVSQATLKAAVKEGLVEESSRQVYRRPLNNNPGFAGKVRLTDVQKKAADDIMEDSRQVHLLFGVTGSGKTEVYMELMARMIEQKRQVIVLIPEIALTLQTVSRFYGRFGDRVSVMNSKLSDGERYDQYLRAKRGDIDVVVGPRSALFMPFERLGMIIIDEEHDGAYKSEKSPKYHAREAAVWRARMCGAKVVLGSATPSVISYTKALSGEYGLHKLTERAKKDSALPNVFTADLREEFKQHNYSIFSRKLKQMMGERLKRHEQIMLFLNRRGFAGFVSCRSCGYVLKCKHCDVSLTAHAGGILKCHYCGFEMPVPKVCPQCGSKYIAGFGTGTQKVEQMVHEAFPQAKVLRMDKDAVTKKDSMETILSDFRAHKADILVGTQMIVKGHDFPKVTLVGILAADLSMYAGDYMACERTFGLLVQAAGRAGRDSLAGDVVIQTYQPDHYSVKAAAAQDYEAFYEQEIVYRQMMHYPPAAHIRVILGECADEAVLEACMKMLAQSAGEYIEKTQAQAEIVGPANAYVSKGKDAYRKVLYIKSSSLELLIRLKENAENCMQRESRFRSVYIQFDLDPMTMY